MSTQALGMKPVPRAAHAVFLDHSSSRSGVTQHLHTLQMTSETTGCTRTAGPILEELWRHSNKHIATLK